MAADTAPTEAAGPNIYAEFLPRLGRISVVIHLPTQSTHKTKVLVSRDGLHLIVDHDGASTKLRLPVKTRIAGEHLPGEVKPGHDKISWRLFPTPVEAEAAKHVAPDSVPWSAADLKPGLGFACRACDETIIAEETIKTFKDLPSENWAEMMEFWHCHKPTDVHSTGTAAGDTQNKASGDDLASRGYGANSIISAQPGVGFVDLMTILFSQNDCKCLMVSISNSIESVLHPTSTSHTPFSSGRALKKGSASLVVWLPIHLPEIEPLLRLALSKLPRNKRALASALRLARFEAGSQPLCFSPMALRAIGPVAISQSHMNIGLMSRNIIPADRHTDPPV